jgi:antitoxin component YwqK of YwqJK toxin-antitoxin module
MKFEKFNSEEYYILKDVLNNYPLMDHNIAYLVESFIYKTIREYYSSEEVKLKYEYVVRFDKKHGKYTTWYENGNKDIECFYKDGKLEGEYKCWYKNGNKEVECFYKDDKLEGEYKKYNSNSNIISYLIYENDEFMASLI